MRDRSRYLRSRCPACGKRVRLDRGGYFVSHPNLLRPKKDCPSSGATPQRASKDLEFEEMMRYLAAKRDKR